jgi:hypothetical protein
MPTTAVVLSYPAHFYQTLLSLDNLKKHAPQIITTIVIVDDVSNQTWPGYIDACKEYYKCDRMILVSEIPGIQKFRKWPYVRQQFVKLNLDTIIEDSTWLFLDGDIQLRAGIPSGVMSTRIQSNAEKFNLIDPGPGEKSSQILFYIRFILGVDFRGFWDNKGTMITCSHPPVRVMSAEILKSLRSYVEHLHQTSFLKLHQVIAADQRYSMCEWDLIECFRQMILGQPADWNYEHDFIDATWESDRELGCKWFEARGQEIDLVLWNQLPLVKYL